MIHLFKSASAIRWRVGRKRITKMASEDGGQALIELALSMAIYTTIIIGSAEFARLAYAGIEVANAARAGAAYGAQNHITEMNTATMQSVAQADAPNVKVLTATAAALCKCSNGVAITCANAGTVCTARVLTYVQVSTKAIITPLIRLPLLPSIYTLQSVAVMRVQQ